MRRRPRYSAEEFHRRGEEIFSRRVRDAVKEENPQKFVAIDIETEDYEIDADQRAATDRLFARHPDAQPWVRRVGFEAAHSIGSPRPLSGRPAESRT